MEFLKEVIFAIAGGSGFAALDWKTVVMLVIACVLLYMGIGKGFEPLLLVPIAFGMLLANLPITGLFAEPVYDAATHSGTVGFMWVLYQGVQYAIYPSIIFMGIGAMTDFGPLLANPMSLLLGAAAQLGARLPRELPRLGARRRAVQRGGDARRRARCRYHDSGDEGVAPLWRGAAARRALQLPRLHRRLDESGRRERGGEVHRALRANLRVRALRL